MKYSIGPAIGGRNTIVVLASVVIPQDKKGSNSVTHFVHILYYRKNNVSMVTQNSLEK